MLTNYRRPRLTTTDDNGIKHEVIRISVVISSLSLKLSSLKAMNFDFKPPALETATAKMRPRKLTSDRSVSPTPCADISN
jgi:hypothetical protein